MEFKLVSQSSDSIRTLPLSQAIIAGWTGRDTEAMEHHIQELEALGISRPASTPMYYQVAAARLTQDELIEVSGPDSSGEVEFMLVRIDDAFWIGIGSDHTDRKLETVGVAISKQVCDKPIGTELWPLDEVLPHWDQLILRAYILENNERVLYQEGPVTTMKDPLELVAGFEAQGGNLTQGSVMFCGTLAARGGIRPSRRFEFELEDPVLQRKIEHAYDIVELPVAG